MGLPSQEGAGGPGNGTFYDDTPGSLPNEQTSLANGQSSTTRPRNGSGDPNAPQEQGERQRQASGDEAKQRKDNKRRPSGQQRICGKCQRQLTGQFVRALGDTYHLECFTCHVSFHCFFGI